MTIDYVDLDALQAFLWPASVSPADTDRKALLDAVHSASRWVEDRTGRKFYASTQTRYYQAEEGDILFVDDLLSVTNLYTDCDGDGTYEDTWTTSDYYLAPYSASVDGQPYTMIEIAPQGDYYFPVGMRRGVKIEGSWGYSSTAPQIIKDVATWKAEKLYLSKYAPSDVSGNESTGEGRPQINSEAQALLMLEPYKRSF
jgi:hypothetical protein